MWLPEIDRVSGPKYLSISAALRRDIEAGRLRQGDRLPPQRELAEALGVDLGTVTRGYAEARRLGLIDADGRRGSFVKGFGGAPLSQEQIAPFDTGMNLPPIPLHSSLPERFASDVREILSGPSASNRLQYQPTGGAPVDRQAGADWLALRGIKAHEDTVLVVSGAQTALHAIAHAALDEGDAVCTASFVYPGWLSVARRRGLSIVPLASDEEGVLPDALDVACASRTIRALYLVPTNDNPTATTMGLQRRHDIVEVARRHDILIIEDDAYGLLASRPPPPLASLAPERTWHIAGLSKIISPSLRIAYLHAPTVRDTWRLSADVHETSIMAPPLNVAVATKWLREGNWGGLVDEVRSECVHRQRLVAQVLPEGSYRANPEGYHLWIELSGDIAPAEIVSALASSGLLAVSSEVFAADRKDSARCIRVSIGGGLSRERLARALPLLDTLLHHRGDRAAPVV